MDAGGLFFLALFLLLYFLPVLIAMARHNRVVAVIVVDILLGWTVIGWFVAFGLAFARPRAARGTPPAATVDRAATVADRHDSTRDFLQAMLDRGVLDVPMHRRLLAELTVWQERFPATSEDAPPAGRPIVAAPVAAPSPPPTPTPALAKVSRPIPPPPRAPEAPRVTRPAPWAPWLAQVTTARAVIRSDFAVHGLAYLGVLLTFTGTLGFVLFAYSTVNNEWLRALGPLAVPLFLGITAWWLYRRGSVLVSVSLELLGAALVAVLLSAALSTAFHDGAQIFARTAMALALAAIYALAVIRRPASPLKFLVAPMVWMAVWTAGLAFRNNHYSAAQVALTAAAIVLTVMATRLFSGHRLAQPTRMAAVAGIGAVYTLSILFAITEGGPPLPIVLTGAAVLVTVELLALHGRQALQLALLQSSLLAITLTAAALGWSLASIGLLAAAGYLAILEWQERRRQHLYAAALPLAGLTIGLLLSLGEPWPALVAGGLLTAWVHGRRIRPLPSMTALPLRAWTPGAIGGAAVVPLVFASGLWRLIPQGRSLLILAALLVGATLVARRFRPTDPFYAWWVPAAGAAIAITTLFTRGTVSDAELAVAVALTGGALAYAPRWPIGRIWSSVPTFAWASVLLFDAVKLGAGARPIVWAVAGLALVAIASTRASIASAHLAVAGYGTTATALYLSDSGGPRVATLATWVAASVIGTVAQERGRAHLLLLTRWAARSIQLPERAVLPQRALLAVLPLVFVASAPFLVAEAGAFTGLLRSTHRSWTGIALAVTAIGYSAGARWAAGRHPLAGVLAIAAVVLSGIGIAVAAPDLEPSILTVGGSLLVVGIMGGALRRPFMSWFAWTMAIVLTLLLARKLGVAAGSLHLVLIGVGGVMLVGGLLYDDLGAGRRQAGDGLRVPWLAAPVGLGALAVPVGLAFSFTEKASVYGWWSLAAAALYLVLAILLRTGAVSGIAYALAAFGAAALLPWPALDHPTAFVPIVAVLAAVAFALSRLPRSSDRWARWDLPPLVVAHAAAALALARTIDVGSVAVVWAALGALSFAVFAWRRHWAWSMGGAALLLVGADAAGPGWFALALGSASAVAAALAARAAGAHRIRMLAGSVIAAAAAWLATLAWVHRPAEQQIVLTAITATLIALLLAVATRWFRLRRDWAWSWGALATAGLLTAAALAPPQTAGTRVAALVVAACLLAYALASAVASNALRWPRLAWLSIGSLALAWLELLASAGWTPGQATALTAVLGGALAAVLAVLYRAGWLTRPWLHPAIAGAVLALVSAGVMAAALVGSVAQDQRLANLGVAIGSALFAIAAAAVARRLWWPALPWVAVTATAGAWGNGAAAAGLSVDQGVAATALAAGAIALLIGVALRRAAISRPWVYSHATLATVGLTGAVATGITVGNQRHPYALVVAGGLALYATAMALAAQPLGRSWFREVAAVIVVASLGGALYDWQPPVERAVTTAVGLALAGLLGSLAVWSRRPASAWLRPLALGAGLTSAGAIVLAMAAWPNRGPLIITLLVIGAEGAAVGLTLRHPTPLYASPILACAAWLLFATDALHGNADWVTAPIGLAILATVELARWDHRRGNRYGDQRLIGHGLIVLEYTGMVFLVGAALVETVFSSVWYGLLALALGVVLVGWAAFTRVRRRTEVGALVVVLALFLMLAVPVIRVIPEVRGIALWGTVAAVGILLLVVATTIEQSRARVMAGVHRLEQLMAGWE